MEEIKKQLEQAKTQFTSLSNALDKFKSDKAKLEEQIIVVTNNLNTLSGAIQAYEIVLQTLGDKKDVQKEAKKG